MSVLRCGMSLATVYVQKLVQFIRDCVMLKSFLIISLRNLRKQAGYTLINILGLSIGIAAFSLIMLYVSHQLSIDKFNHRYDDIVRLEYREWCVLPPGYKKILEGQFPEVEKITRPLFWSYTNTSVRYGENRWQTKKLGYAEPDFFELFDLGFIQGNPAMALNEPWSLVLTQDMARKIFGTKNPIGEMIILNNNQEYRVTGVVENPDDSHFDFELLASQVTLKTIYRSDYLDDVYSSNFPFYLLLKSGVDHDALGEKIDSFIKGYFYDRGEEQWSANFHLRPLSEIYFARNLVFEGGTKHGNRAVVYIFIAAALFILLIACINFVNLTTARSALRAREVGVKKVLGVMRWQLIVQFLFESVIIASVAVIIGLTLAEFFLPVFNGFTGISLAFPCVNGFEVLGCIVFSGLLLGFFAGLYPAFYLTQTNILSVLKCENFRGKGGGRFRRLLTIFQFIVSIVLLIGTFVIYNQMKFIRHKDPGFEKANLVFMELNRQNYRQCEDFATSLRSLPGVLDVQLSHGIPGNIANTETYDIDKEARQFRVSSVSPGYLNMMGMELVGGRDFDDALSSDKYSKAILNEEAVRYLGWGDSVVNRVFVKDSMNFSALSTRRVEVIGVVRDFHFESMHQPISPLIYCWNPEMFHFINVRLTAGDPAPVLEAMNNLWHEYSPDYPFDYQFLDIAFDGQYGAEEKQMNLMVLFSLLAIFIACLGLFGMASFMTSRRMREIGVRKTFGASSWRIVWLLSGEFGRWVLLANLLAWPLGWWIMHRWLFDFAYRDIMPWWAFVLASLVVLVVALVTIWGQAWRGARTNPAKALKYE